ncbi:MAG TPA: glutathione S-transferase family protein [Polyangiaceae bacterium]|nr:glutathione S-transferase family protein [Polyangiaceae bacterium]
MSYQLYGELGSGAGIVEVALAAAGVPYEFRAVSLDKSEQRSETYARLNPQRKLPTLITPAGETLTESAAILLVLDERHPGARLFPLPRMPERAQALRWLVFAAAELYSVIEISDYPERFTPHGGNAPAVRELARSLWRERWQIVEAQIAGDPWLLHSGFCFTDVYLASLSRWSFDPAWRAQHLPKVEKLAAAIATQPIIGDVWRKHYARSA